MTKERDHALSPAERRAALGLAGVYGTRMLGLFLILPVFALYAETLPGATPLLTGLAIGIYGLTQALLQIPFGLLSDRLGRKPVILGGLALFALGSVVAASAEDMLWIVAGRALQGSGAVAAAIMALAADLTREEQRTKIMATIGMTIGLSFMLAMIAGPALDAWVGVPGIFWITAGLALAGMALIAWVVPTPLRSSVHRDAEPVPALFRRVLTQADLLRLDLGIFSLHLILTALFLAVPLLLRDAGVAPANHALVYLPIMLIAIIGMVPLVILSEKGGHMKGVFLGAISTLGVAQLLIWRFGHQFWPLVLAVALFFVAFNLLEAILPSLVSKTAPPDAKGTAMGVYSTSQFTGSFVGGVLGGWLHQHYGVMAPFLFGAGMTLVWLLAASGMRQPQRVASELLHLPETALGDPARIASQLQALPGVVEAVVVPEEGVAYLKVDREHFERAQADAIIGAPA
ncbi:MFS transporter [endosymbiont of unidentified scaly snail isolate Monju]|uniref:MFS transporter n=1 Tax=endosymbiont of unidentified scaly snail isolate Monju TaxID=1248727 RepID=UPI0003892658|nr:MFS transporter [endosymbiont of unidentified scaly snail isolate Monju]BAN68212.1 major facilitator transporter [endosymbiont of unidentified scaly snail isolate Monju]